LKVARVRLVDAGIINLIDDAVTQREPDTATRMIRRTHSFFRARSPARLDSRRPNFEFSRGFILVLPVRWLFSPATPLTRRLRYDLIEHFINRLLVPSAYEDAEISKSVNRKQDLVADRMICTRQHETRCSTARPPTLFS
jgi:hypothetical protein